MENNQPRKKNAGVTALIAVLLIITTIASCVGMYAWARYIAAQDGNGTAQIAKWHFELRNGTSQVESGKQLLALTRTDGYGHVATGKLAPGTFGEFLLEIDTTGTEVTMTYDVDINLEDCPTNLLFYTDSAHTQVLEKTTTQDGVNLHINKYLSLDSSAENYVNKVHLEKIYWNWPYETLDANNIAVAGDAQDKLDEGNVVQMNIVVTGTEVLKAPPATVQSLAQSGTIKRYDVITNYSATGTINTSGLNVRGASIIGNTKVASLNGASIDGTIDASKATDWVVLDVNQQTGEVLIIPRTIDNPNLTLSGIDGYNNAIDAIESVASIYGNSPYAQSVQSMNIELVNRLEGKNLENVRFEGGTTAFFDTNYTLDENYDIQEVQGRITIPESMVFYNYERTVTPNWRCWLASRFVLLHSDNCYFSLYYYSGPWGGFISLFTIGSRGDESEYSSSWPVLPVVTLKSDVLIDLGDTFYTETEKSATPTSDVTDFVHHSWTLK